MANSPFAVKKRKILDGKSYRNFIRATSNEKLRNPLPDSEIPQAIGSKYAYHTTLKLKKVLPLIQSEKIRVKENKQQSISKT